LSKALRCIVFVFLFLTGVAQAQSNDTDTTIYSELETVSQEKFNDAKALLLSKLQSKDENESADALNGLKVLSYQRAYLAYACVKRHGIGKGAERCEKEEGVHLSRFYELLKSIKLIPYNLQASCIIQHRLYREEAEFKPFPFQKFEGDGLALYNFEKLNDCLIAGLQSSRR
jgi:hypothetical protein